jgi:hypothetical protein
VPKALRLWHLGLPWCVVLQQQIRSLLLNRPKHGVLLWLSQLGQTKTMAAEYQ